MLLKGYRGLFICYNYRGLYCKTRNTICEFIFIVNLMFWFSNMIIRVGSHIA